MTHNKTVAQLGEWSLPTPQDWVQIPPTVIFIKNIFHFLSFFTVEINENM